MKPRLWAAGLYRVFNKVRRERSEAPKIAIGPGKAYQEEQERAGQRLGFAQGMCVS